MISLRKLFERLIKEDTGKTADYARKSKWWKDRPDSYDGVKQDKSKIGSASSVPDVLKKHGYKLVDKAVEGEGFDGAEGPVDLYHHEKHESNIIHDPKTDKWDWMGIPQDDMENGQGHRELDKHLEKTYK